MNNESKQILQEFHFIINEQFELNEFNVKTENSFFVEGIEYEVYTYIKDDLQSVLDVKFNSIQLCYNADILSVIKYEFNSDVLELLIRKIELHLPSNKKNEYVVDDVFLFLKVKESTVELYLSKVKL